jgi:hypothetical protein
MRRARRKEFRVAFTTHDVVIKGALLGALVEELAAQRVARVSEPKRTDKFIGGSASKITALLVQNQTGAQSLVIRALTGCGADRRVRANNAGVTARCVGPPGYLPIVISNRPLNNALVDVQVQQACGDKAFRSTRFNQGSCQLKVLIPPVAPRMEQTQPAGQLKAPAIRYHCPSTHCIGRTPIPDCPLQIRRRACG